MTSRHDQQPRTICDFGVTTSNEDSFQRQPPATSSRYARSDELRARSTQSNESHTRSDELRARSRFATHGRDQQRTGNHRAQRAPQKGAEEKNSTALRYHVCRVSALCPARNFRSRSNQTMGCAHAWMSGRAYESSLSMSRLVHRLKTTSAVLWQCGWSGTNTPPDEGAKLPPPGVLALCQLSALSHSRKCRFNTFKQFVLVLRDPHLLWQPRPKPDMFGSPHEQQTIWTESNYKSN